MSNFAPLNTLAAQLGEDTVIEMARAYIQYVSEKRAGIQPNGWQQIRKRLWQQTMNASVDNTDDLILMIKQAENEGIRIDDETYIDAISRLDALQASRLDALQASRLDALQASRLDALQASQ